MHEEFETYKVRRSLRGVLRGNSYNIINKILILVIVRINVILILLGCKILCRNNKKAIMGNKIQVMPLDISLQKQKNICITLLSIISRKTNSCVLLQPLAQLG